MKKSILFLFALMFFLVGCPMGQQYSNDVVPEWEEPFYIEALDDNTDIISVSMRTLKITYIVPTFLYSIDGGEKWKNVNLTNDEDSTQSFNLAPGERVYIKANQTNTSLSGKLAFKSTGYCKIGGNIMSLLNTDPEVYAVKDVSAPTTAFLGIFQSFDGLKDASCLILPSQNLGGRVDGSRCYSAMFANSQDLELPPELPATRLAEGCYSEMFLNCKNLKVAPALNSKSLATKCYYSMFQGCEKLEEAPSLPAITMADQCYQYMFSGCKLLTTPPELPAANFAENCYYGMFQDCEKLVEAPVLNATEKTNMRKSCYSHMFSGCKALTKAPALPSINLADGCYENMFYNCEALTQAPSLPADTLKNSCYARMFSGCTQLKEITVAFDEWKTSATDEWVKDVYKPTEGEEKKPTFNATSRYLTRYTGQNRIPEGWKINGGREEGETVPEMEPIEYEEGALSQPLYFEAVDNSIEIRILANTAFRDKLNLLPKISRSLDDCTTWQECTITDLENTTDTWRLSRGQKVYLKAKESQSTIDGIHFTSTGKVKVGGNIMSLLESDRFSGLTKVNINSFQNLFKDMQKLTDAQDLLLPATELASSCYAGMFAGCESLENAPVLPPTNLHASCYSQMFSGCKALKNAPELKSTVLSSYCYSEMFKNCESLTQPPELPAKYIAISCYSQMFEGCKNLKTAPDLPAKVMFESCYYKMFQGCKELTQAPDLPKMNGADDKEIGVLANLCYSYMFADCYKLATAPSLASTQLKTGCYAAMFMGCRALKNAPSLPAQELQSTCYVSMFKDCQSLERVEVHFKSWNTQYTSDWMAGVKDGGVFVCDERYLVTDDLERGVDTIPSSWTTENIPE